MEPQVLKPSQALSLLLRSTARVLDRKQLPDGDITGGLTESIAINWLIATTLIHDAFDAVVSPGLMFQLMERYCEPAMAIQFSNVYRIIYFQVHTCHINESTWKLPVDVRLNIYEHGLLAKEACRHPYPFLH